MNRTLTSLLACWLLLAGCSKTTDVKPTASFSYALVNKQGAAPAGLFPTYENIRLANASANGATYAWDFGNGTTSTEQNPVIRYAKSGTYTIRLTSTSATGGQSTSSQTIKVVDRVLQRITIRSLNWNALQTVPTWTGNKTAGLTLVIGQLNRNASSYVPAAVLYESLSAYTASTTTAFDIPVVSRYVLDLANSNDLVFNLYGDDGAGKQLVFTTGGSGIATDASLDTGTNYFTVKSSFQGTAISLLFNYE